jgi:hypothetical protein
MIWLCKITICISLDEINMSYRKPTKGEIRDAEGKRVPDVIALGLKVVFCGINPGLYSGAVSHHFARPGNRFWPISYLDRYDLGPLFALLLK